MTLFSGGDKKRVHGFKKGYFSNFRTTKMICSNKYVCYHDFMGVCYFWGCVHNYMCLIFSHIRCCSSSQRESPLPNVPQHFLEGSHKNIKQAKNGGGREGGGLKWYMPIFFAYFQ